MAQFSVNPQRFDPYKNFKFRVKWDGRYVAGISKVSALKRSTEVVEHREGGDPSTGAQVARPHQVRGDHAGARRHPRHRVREVGEQGLELRLRPRRRGVAQGLPQGPHHRVLQRGRASWRSPTRCSAAGCRSSRRCPTSTPTPTRSRSRRSSWRTRAGSATRRHRADRAQLHRAGLSEAQSMRRAAPAVATCRCSTLWERAVGLDRWRRDDALLAAASAAPRGLGARNAALLAHAQRAVRPRMAAAEPLPACATRVRVRGRQPRAGRGAEQASTVGESAHVRLGGPADRGARAHRR